MSLPKEQLCPGLWGTSRDPLGAGDHHCLLWKPVMGHILDLAGRREGLDSNTSALGLSFLLCLQPHKLLPCLSLTQWALQPG